jgi:hypothetical protein
VVSGIPIPDLRVEFENDAKEIERVDLELATREYRSRDSPQKRGPVSAFTPVTRMLIACAW